MDKLIELKQTPNAAGQKRNSPVPPRSESPAKRRRSVSSPATKAKAPYTGRSTADDSAAKLSIQFQSLTVNSIHRLSTLTYEQDEASFHAYNIWLACTKRDFQNAQKFLAHLPFNFDIPNLLMTPPDDLKGSLTFEFGELTSILDLPGVRDADAFRQALGSKLYNYLYTHREPGQTSMPKELSTICGGPPPDRDHVLYLDRPPHGEDFMLYSVDDNFGLSPLKLCVELKKIDYYMDILRKSFKVTLNRRLSADSVLLRKLTSNPNIPNWLEPHDLQLLCCKLKVETATQILRGLQNRDKLLETRYVAYQITDLLNGFTPFEILYSRCTTLEERAKALTHALPSRLTLTAEQVTELSKIKRLNHDDIEKVCHSGSRVHAVLGTYVLLPPAIAQEGTMHFERRIPRLAFDSRVFINDKVVTTLLTQLNLYSSSKPIAVQVAKYTPLLSQVFNANKTDIFKMIETKKGAEAMRKLNLLKLSFLSQHFLPLRQNDIEPYIFYLLMEMVIIDDFNEDSGVDLFPHHFSELATMLQDIEQGTSVKNEDPQLEILRIQLNEIIKRLPRDEVAKWQNSPEKSVFTALISHWESSKLEKTFFKTHATTPDIIRPYLELGAETIGLLPFIRIIFNKYNVGDYLNRPEVIKFATRLCRIGRLVNDTLTLEKEMYESVEKDIELYSAEIYTSPISHVQNYFHQIGKALPLNIVTVIAQQQLANGHDMSIQAAFEHISSILKDELTELHKESTDLTAVPAKNTNYLAAIKLCEEFVVNTATEWTLLLREEGYRYAPPALNKAGFQEVLDNRQDRAGAAASKSLDTN